MLLLFRICCSDWECKIKFTGMHCVIPVNAFIQGEIGINVLFVFPFLWGVCCVSQLNSRADIHFNQLFHPQVTCSVQFVISPSQSPEKGTQKYCSSVLCSLPPVKCCLQCQQSPHLCRSVVQLPREMCTVPAVSRGR